MGFSATNPRRPRFVATTGKVARRTPEWRLQAEAVSALRKTGWPIVVAGDMNAARRSPAERAKAKVTGMAAGEPDLRIYLPGARLGLIEFKGKGGTLSADQKAHHAALAALGHKVMVIRATTPAEAAEATTRLVAAWLGHAANDNGEGR